MTHAPSTSSTTSHDATRTDVIVVGGGLAGLTAAATLARAGRSVTVVEQASTLGGRAGTQLRDGFSFNRGAHALYTGGAAADVLANLGIRPVGHAPSADGAFAVRGDRTHTLPVGFVGLLTTGLLSLGGKLEAARIMASLPRLDPAPFASLPFARFLDERVRDPQVRELVLSLVRVLTYTNDPEGQSTGVVITQAKALEKKPVLYLDGGWQSLTEALRNAATTAGATVISGARAHQVELAGPGPLSPNGEPFDGAQGRRVGERGEARVAALLLEDGRRLEARSIVLAVAPRVASALVRGGKDATLSAWADRAVPVRACCLDVALRSLPRPYARFALGMDRPTYLSVHSATAALAPDGGALIHAMRYLAPHESPGKEGIAELEGLLDRLQPGWRDVLVARQDLPSIIVTHDQATAARGGLPGRPGPHVPSVSGLFVAGDWVGPRGFLADAAFASGEDAALLAHERLGALALAA